MKKLFATISLIFVLSFATIFCGCQFFNSSDTTEEDTYTKDINANDLELEYTVYEDNYIRVYVTPLIDIKNLNVQVCFYQAKNFLNQKSEWIDEKYIQKGTKHLLTQSISSDIPFDRVSLLSISGKKDENSTDFTEKKRVGTIRSKPKSLDTKIFNFRLDTSYAENTVIGRLYITSPIDLWDANFWISYTDENSNMHYRQPNLEVDRVIANKEFYIILRKLLGKDIKVKNLSIEQATSREIKATIINEELQIITKNNAD